LQVLAQAQKWHLDLDADLAEMENRYVGGRFFSAETVFFVGHLGDMFCA
jgi:hypothetical protein